MSSYDYWKEREEAQRKKDNKDMKSYSAEIKKIYQSMMDQISDEIHTFYSKYASDTGITMAEAIKRATEKGIQVNVLGVGSPEGSPIPSEGENDYRRDREGNIIVTRLNEQMCQQIAQAGKGIYVRVDNTNNAQRAISKEINKLAKADVETQVYTDFNEQFQAVAWIILILLLGEMLILECKNPLLRNMHLFPKR